MQGGGGYYLRRRLEELTEVPFTVTVPGETFTPMYDSVSHFLLNYQEVTTALGVDESEVSSSFFQFLFLVGGDKKMSLYDMCMFLFIYLFLCLLLCYFCRKCVAACCVWAVRYLD